jgi:hypothetical protein
MSGWGFASTASIISGSHSGRYLEWVASEQDVYVRRFAWPATEFSATDLVCRSFSHDRPILLSTLSGLVWISSGVTGHWFSGDWFGRPLIVRQMACLVSDTVRSGPRMAWPASDYLATDLTSVWLGRRLICSAPGLVGHWLSNDGPDRHLSYPMTNPTGFWSACDLLDVWRCQCLSWHAPGIVAVRTCKPLVNALFLIVILRVTDLLAVTTYFLFFNTGLFLCYMQFEGPGSVTISPREVRV